MDTHERFTRLIRIEDDLETAKRKLNALADPKLYPNGQERNQYVSRLADSLRSIKDAMDAIDSMIALNKKAE